MSELNKIYEITQKLSSPDNLRDDFKEILDIAIKHFSSKYLTPINVAIASHKEYCDSHPCKEVNLLKAFKPFVENSDGIDKLIDAVNTLRLFSLVSSQDNTPPAVVSAASINDSAIHPDGIYEVDEGCISTNSQSVDKGFNIDPAILLFLLFFVVIK